MYPAFDPLVLARDGSTVYFECKVGAGGMQELTKKVFHQQRAFTPESKFVLCKTCDGTKARQVRSDLHRQYRNLGGFDTVLWDPSKSAHEEMPGLGSALQQVDQALNAAWSSLRKPSGS